MDVRCGVSFNVDQQATKETVTEAVKTVEGLVWDRGGGFFLRGVRGELRQLRRALLDRFFRTGLVFQARSDAVETINTEFDEADLDIPYPIRTIDLQVPNGSSIEDVLRN